MSFLRMKTNLVFITFLALLIVIKRRGLVLRSFRYQDFYWNIRAHTTHNTIIVKVLYLEPHREFY